MHISSQQTIHLEMEGWQWGEYFNSLRNRWVLECPLISKPVPSSSVGLDEQSRVNELTLNGDWNVSLLKSLFDGDLAELSCIPIPRRRQEDVMVWGKMGVWSTL